MPSYSRVAWIVLVPALAFAGPRHHHKSDKAKAAAAAKEAAAKEAAAKEAAAKEAADAKDANDAKDAAKPDDKPGSLLSTGTVGGGAGSGSAARPPRRRAPRRAPARTRPERPIDLLPPTTPDVDSLRQEYLSLRDELFKSRARADAVASQLYSTRITIRLTGRRAGTTACRSATVRLDGASVYEDARARSRATTACGSTATSRPAAT